MNAITQLEMSRIRPSASQVAPQIATPQTGRRLPISIRNWMLERLSRGSLSCLLVSMILIISVNSRTAADDFEQYGRVSATVSGVATLLGYKLLDFLIFHVVLSATTIQFGPAILLASIGVWIGRSVICDALILAQRREIPNCKRMPVANI